MKKTALTLAFITAFAFSGFTYANIQDKPASAKTETVCSDDQKKSDASSTEKKKDCTENKKESPKKTEKD